jgi:hypothetical protein
MHNDRSSSCHKKEDNDLGAMAQRDIDALCVSSPRGIFLRHFLRKSSCAHEVLLHLQKCYEAISTAELPVTDTIDEALDHFP